MKYHIGIDIGKKGGIVSLGPTGQIVAVPMPLIKDEVDYHSLVTFLRPYKELGEGRVHVVFERLQAIFKTSKGSAFSLGHQAGAVEMACIALDIPFTKVGPKIWQKEMFEGIPAISKEKGTDTKAMALLAAKRLFPNQPLTFGRAVKPHEGIVDALLMSEFSRRHY